MNNNYHNYKNILNILIAKSIVQQTVKEDMDYNVIYRKIDHSSNRNKKP
jgi:hypothetical protein